MLSVEGARREASSAVGVECAVLFVCESCTTENIGVSVMNAFTSGAVEAGRTEFEAAFSVSSVAPQGTVVISWVGLSAVGGAVCCCRAWSMVAKSRFHAVRGRCSMQRTSSFATCSVCSMGVSVGS